ncbi:MAG: hypothetical protein ACRDMH_02810 [Solirubrobacterales bacterium]
MTHPTQVVSVRSVPYSVRRHYYRPGVYSLRQRRDGVEVYRLVRNVGKPRSSKRAAERDGRELAQKLRCPYRIGVKHNTRADEVAARSHTMADEERAHEEAKLAARRRKQEWLRTGREPLASMSPFMRRRFEWGQYVDEMVTPGTRRTPEERAQIRRGYREWRRARATS